MSFQESAREFLSQQRIAVVGVSRSGSATGNAIFKALRDQGHTVIPMHPDATTIEDVPCYPNLQAIPDGVDGVVIVTRPDVTEKIVQDAVAAGVPRVWMHGNALFGIQNSSVSQRAVAYGREHGLDVIDGGCPLMFVDFGHKCMRWILGATGKLPQ
ncbi:MAG: CoA-binding protein [Chloroflexi bacterium AL-W]|nr:CoA-binding protein [Chloroflexi bacterium AL-N1]NOK68806.1 CoA-binding protein [Chloroflexi bacterium AL-N10]NOK76292.1 CoA-binding protein [Chloroflexi bacterium AL-N5]NOK84071.1 CoA-binding protein [Chloroflexi bacterium AL-W]NOK91430.1 CoA-binding protein [Chloroflexi bacterium AL-N15]